ncbi:MarR family winged helix-turn-helix transcriptional regulator [Alkalibacterium putridalgicola]|uniref:Transcriptional regulator n=1 Tax=Alkalibacterium putridalgicola TaxID=426703 RepID=A0A1H7VC48_9LACT|nr:MarR family transcriptional regulator [Alkalibacterium putridalgicola]GEK88618.1 organic hydroperoxide resistance transcriptional regulator [Alkalibacterium putridalgicola]SEM06438.1 transcriptional regulator [Alkalibacterium putridalgicola]
MSKNILKLSNQVCFPLYAATRQITKLYRPMLEKLEVTYPQYLVLLVLFEDVSVTVKELGERLYLDSGTLTPMLKRMEEHGLVERKRSSKDERVVEVSLTEKGRSIEKKAEEIPNRFSKEIHLEQDEFDELKRLLTKILDQV